MPCTCTTNFEPARRLKIGPHPTGSRSGSADRPKPIPPPFRQDRDVWMAGNRPRHAGTGNGLRRRCLIEGPSRERSALAAAAGGLTVHPQPMLFRSFDHLIRWLTASRLRPPSFTCPINTGPSRCSSPEKFFCSWSSGATHCHQTARELRPNFGPP
jgi:hypothetical protein